LNAKRHFCAVACALACVACGGSEKATQTQALVETYARDNHIPAIGLAVSSGGVEREAVFHGKANLELDVDLTRDSVFRIASVTKVFTAVGIMVLKDQGLLNTTDLLSKYVDFPRGGEVTLKMMLQHTSGLPEFTAVDSFDQNQAHLYTPQEIVALVKDVPYQFEPGTSAKYTNTNFLLLGLVIEKVSGLSYADFIFNKVAVPLGMKGTMVGADDTLLDHRVAGYTWDNAYKNAEFVSVVSPFATGDLVSRPVELILLANAFRKGKSPLLSDASLEEMTTGAFLKDGTLFTDTRKAGFTTTFGYGLELRKPDGQDEWIVSKGGSLPGFKSTFLYFRKSDTGCVANGNGDADLFDLCKQAAEAAGAVP